jgi:hypothetical protein
MKHKSKFTGWGIALGALLGAVFGVLAGHMVIWLALGVVIGMALGALLRRKEPTCPECAQMHTRHANERFRVGRGTNNVPAS